jgi:predicted lipoprotein with Yx(FWY)xxD motif
MTRAPLLTLMLAAALLAACADDAQTGAMASGAAAARALEDGAGMRAAAAGARAPEDGAGMRAAAAGGNRQRRGTTVKVVRSQFGRILGDGRGQAVYFFDAETSATPRCYGECARAWPPVLARGKPVAAGGARPGLLGVTRRRNGDRQVTYDGRPLYFYVDDAPGRVLCHNVEEFGGLWLVGRADGTPVG